MEQLSVEVLVHGTTLSRGAPKARLLTYDVDADTDCPVATTSRGVFAADKRRDCARAVVAYKRRSAAAISHESFGAVNAGSVAEDGASSRRRCAPALCPTPAEALSVVVSVAAVV